MSCPPHDHCDCPRDNYTPPMSGSTRRLMNWDTIQNEEVNRRNGEIAEERRLNWDFDRGGYKVLPPVLEEAGMRYHEFSVECVETPGDAPVTVEQAREALRVLDRAGLLWKSTGLTQLLELLEEPSVGE